MGLKHLLSAIWVNMNKKRVPICRLDEGEPDEELTGRLVGFYWCLKALLDNVQDRNVFRKLQ